MDIKTAPVVIVALGLVAIGDKGRETGNQADALAKHVFQGAVFRRFVVGICGQNASCQLVHNITAGGFENHIFGKTFGQIAVFAEQSAKLLKVFFAGQFTKHQ